VAQARARAILLAIAICNRVDRALRDRRHRNGSTPSRRRASASPRPAGDRFLGAAAFVVEAAIESWSALFLEAATRRPSRPSGPRAGHLRRVDGVRPLLRQAAGRLSDRALLGGGSLLATAGCAIVAVGAERSDRPRGFALGGGGHLAQRAGRLRHRGPAGPDAGTAVAHGDDDRLLGLLVGPALVGGIAQATSLRISFAALAAIAAAVAAATARVRLD